MKNGKLINQVAVVTGASKGIGAGIARQLAAEGAAVVVNHASSKEGADQVVDEISKRGGKAIAIQADVAKKKDIERLFAETRKAFGRLDILVNNADRKSTRLNSSHSQISYAVFCLKKDTTTSTA